MSLYVDPIPREENWNGIGAFSPFLNDVDPYDETTEAKNYNGTENVILSEVSIYVWPNGGYDEGEEKCEIEVCVFYGDAAYARAPLFEFIRRCVFQDHSGPKAGAIALRKLQKQIETMALEFEAAAELETPDG